MCDAYDTTDCGHCQSNTSRHRCIALCTTTKQRCHRDTTKESKYLYCWQHSIHFIDEKEPEEDDLLDIPPTLKPPRLIREKHPHDLEHLWDTQRPLGEVRRTFFQKYLPDNFEAMSENHKQRILRSRQMVLRALYKLKSRSHTRKTLQYLQETTPKHMKYPNQFIRDYLF